MTIDLSNLKNITSPHFYPAYSNRKKFQIYWGSQGSGKSYFIASKIILRILTDRQQHRVLVMRKVHAKIRDSVFNLFKQVIKDWGLEMLTETTSTPFSIKFPAFNDSEIIFYGADDDGEKLKSINNINKIWLEEAVEFEDESTVDQIIDRIRGRYKYPPEIFFSFNPVSEKHFLKRKFFDDLELQEQTFLHHSTWKDNPFVDPDYGAGMKLRYKNNVNAYNVRVLGIWGNDQFGGECYHKFSIASNCRKNSYDVDLPLLLSFDFNALPSCSVLVLQIADNELSVLEEISLAHPRNRPIHLCQEFMRKYGTHTSGVWVTGDASGRGESHKMEAGTNDYTVIFDSLKSMPFLKNYVLSKNASVVQRLEFINDIFAMSQECSIWLDDSGCPKLIEDLTYLKANNEGGKLKQKVKDKTTGATYEKLGHLSDCLDYAVTTFLKAHFKSFIKGSEISLNVGNTYVPRNIF
ncbi:PBSX family phage terminase large subunit [Chryseolinea sp. T2]|uniref:PBSX family phage terminase large subunit n=1 Tax=Chryseolinea sp. T2 TaxID=3129255 RepID=UPI0030784728